MASKIAPTEEFQLLREWFDWWRTTPDLPAKLPNALHVRTALVLEPTNRWRGFGEPT